MIQITGAEEHRIVDDIPTEISDCVEKYIEVPRTWFKLGSTHERALYTYHTGSYTLGEVKEKCSLDAVL